jgi:hypothetical protein
MMGYKARRVPHMDNLSIPRTRVNRYCLRLLLGF